MANKFQLKFIDIMVGIVLGLGFQWWPELKEPWQFVAFIFAYLTLIDYWVDYNPTAKQYAMRFEIDIIVHTAIIFGMFLLILGTTKTISYFLIAFVVYRFADIIWVWRIKREHRVPAHDLVFMNTWLFFDVIEALAAIIFAIITLQGLFTSMVALLIFIGVRAITRILSSVRYKKVFYAM